LAVKRLADISIAALLLVVLSPLLIAIGLAIVLTSHGFPIFRQARLGRGGAPYRICKFRTMYRGSEAKAQRDESGANITTRNDPRVTAVGRVLRKSSLDELPQLWNVMKGEMSLVGPRPDETLALALYSDRDKVKLKMRPGLTGLAVVNGRNSITWRERIAWDVKYVEEFSLRLDFAILLRTVEVVLIGKGTYTSPAA
jgi:lipopolysaccharide/colanic/teichoic acid biosynthesis glycosyltransferase